jgi:hypothetical protein
MDKQNVTVTLPVDILRAARHLAVDRGMSLSRFLGELIEERVDWARRYEEARQRQTRLMREAVDRGTHGAISWTRDELHER